MVAMKLPGRTADLIGPGFGYHIENRARVASILGAIAIGQQLHFPQGIRGRIILSGVAKQRIERRAVKQELIRITARPGDRDSRAAAIAGKRLRRRNVGYARENDGQRNDISAVDRKFRYPPRGDERPYGRWS